MSVSITITVVVMDAGLLPPLGLSRTAQADLLRKISQDLVGHPAAGIPDADGTIRYLKWVTVNCRRWFLMMDVASDGRCLVIGLS